MSAGAKRANPDRSKSKRATATSSSAKPLQSGRPVGEKDSVDDGVTLTPAELRRRRTRNIAIALTLGALVILFYVMTLARLGSNVMNRPL